jgi:hypothetical protein
MIRVSQLILLVYDMLWFSSQMLNRRTLLDQPTLNHIFHRFALMYSTHLHISNSIKVTISASEFLQPSIQSYSINTSHPRHPHASQAKHHHIFQTQIQPPTKHHGSTGHRTRRYGGNGLQPPMGLPMYVSESARYPPRQIPIPIQKLTKLGPKLTHAQWEICESYGGWTRFVDHYGLKRPYERVQWTEGVKILDILARRKEAGNPDTPGRGGN